MTDSYLNSIWEKAKSKIQVEGTNIDLKRKWWNFQTELDEFLKDICLMANNHSGESYIILGMDEDGTLHNAPTPEDEANIQQRHKSRIEPITEMAIQEFILDGKTVSVLTIPHSTNRPHIIKKARAADNWIPVRLGTTTLTASRSDLDEMYKERDMSESPSLKASFAEKKIGWADYAGYKGTCFAFKLTLDNSKGSAPEYITSIILKEMSGDHWESKHFKIDRDDKRVDEEYKVDAYDRIQSIGVYVSDTLPDGLGNKRPRPDLDKDTLKVIIKTLSGNEIMLDDIKPGWLEG